MPRVIASEVREIMTADAPPVATAITAHIAAANILVTRECAGAGGVTDADELKEVERFLAAHFVFIDRTRANSEKAGPLTDTYRSKVDLGFKLTHYGQQAMLLDSSGKLAALNNKVEHPVQNVGATFLGSTTDDAWVEQYGGRNP